MSLPTRIISMFAIPAMLSAGFANDLSAAPSESTSLDLIKQCEPLSCPINEQAKFFVVINVLRAAKELDCEDEKGFTKALFSQNMKELRLIAARKEICLLLIYSVSDMSVDDRKDQELHFRKMGVRYPYAIVDTKNKEAKDALAALLTSERNYVYIYDQDKKLLKSGDSTALTFWKEYTIAPISEERLEAKEKDLAEKLEKIKAKNAVLFHS